MEMMKKQNAVIGGEGNGGVIYPELHYGRDALVGIALFLSYLAKAKLSCSELRETYPDYSMSKNKIMLSPGLDVDQILETVRKTYSEFPVNSADGVKIDFESGWVHLRKSNTEPIIRVYAEGVDANEADRLANILLKDINSLMNA